MAIMTGRKLQNRAHSLEPDQAIGAGNVGHAVICDPIIPPLERAVLSPYTEPGWLMCEEGFSPAREREIESLFAIINGYVGVRATIGGGRFSNPATFIAGVFVGDKDLGPRLALLPQRLNGDQPRHEWKAWARECVDRLCAIGRARSDAKVRFVMAEGEAGAAIVRGARQSDLIVLGWRGVLEPDRGLTMQRVVRDTASPVIVFRLDKVG